ncbi:MAG: ribosome silencing factor [Clostridiales bacterium]|nr:ribosome silencing factor [Clostridiales bacterium]
MFSPKELALAIASTLEAKNADNIIVLEVSHLTSITDYFVIAGARNVNAVRALSDDLEEKMGDRGIQPRRKEGQAESRWVVHDYSHVIVHLFHEQEREYYNIERLWMDGSNLVRQN